MLTNISFNLINRFKNQLCQSQKWQYHLCGDELCARRAATLFSENRFGSTSIFWSQKSRLVVNKGPFLERNDFWWLSGALIKSPWSKPRITNSSNDLPSYVCCHFTDYCLYPVSISRIHPLNKRTNCLRRTGSTFWLLHHLFRKEKNMHSMPPSSFFPYHFAPCASTTSDCKEEMATTPGRDLYIAKNQKLSQIWSVLPGAPVAFKTLWGHQCSMGWA